MSTKLLMGLLLPARALIQNDPNSSNTGEGKVKKVVAMVALQAGTHSHRSTNSDHCMHQRARSIPTKVHAVIVALMHHSLAQAPTCQYVEVIRASGLAVLGGSVRPSIDRHISPQHPHLQLWVPPSHGVAVHCCACVWAYLSCACLLRACPCAVLSCAVLWVLPCLLVTNVPCGWLLCCAVLCMGR